MIHRLHADSVGLNGRQQRISRRPEAAEPAWRRNGQRRPRRLRRLRFALASAGLLATITLLVWASSWLRPPHSTDLVLLGADYGDNMLVEHNTYGWFVLQDMAELVDHGGPNTWGRSLYDLSHPPLRLHSGCRWDRPLNACRDKTALIYFAAHGCVDEHGPYILLDDAEAGEEAGRLRLDAILDRMAKLPSSQQKILVFDSMAVTADWPLGMLCNDFARSLESRNSRIAEIPNLVVIGAGGPDEQSWASRRWRQTVFGHYLLNGLKGCADDTNQDGRIDTWDLYTSVSRATQHWAKVNRAARQTPFLLPHGRVGLQRARNMDLVPVTSHAAASAVTAPEKFEVPATIVAAWDTCEKLAKHVPSPAAYSPVAWRCYRDLLIRYEALLLAGNQAAATRVRRRMLDCERTLEHDVHCGLSSVQNSLGMFAALADDGVLVQSETSDNGSGGPAQNPRRTLEALWNAAPENWPKRWDAIRKTTGANSLSYARLRMAIQDLIIQRVAEDPPANLQIGSNLIKLLDDPLHTRPAESHFLVMLNRDLPTMGWTDRRRTLVRLALTIRMLAERTAWCITDNSHAYAQRIVPHVRQLLEKADQGRRLGEDLLFADTQDFARAEAYFNESENLYRTAGKRAATRAVAFGIYDRAMADLPYYTRWLARTRPDVRDNRGRYQDGLAMLEKLCRDTHKLGSLLTEPVSKASVEEQVVSEIKSRANMVTDGLGKVETVLQKNWKILASADSPQTWCELHNALQVPQNDPKLRVQLLTSLAQTEQRLETESAQPLARSVLVQQPTKFTKLAVQAQGRMALATLGRAGFEAPTGQAGGAYDELQHRLRVFAVEEAWWQSVAIAGQQIGRAWCRLPKTIDAQLKAAQRGDRADALKVLPIAAELSRLLPSSLSLQVTQEPAAVRRRAELQELLEWQAMRTFTDHWYAELPDAMAYYRVAATGYLDDVDVLLNRWHASQGMRQKIAVVGGLTFLTAKRVDMSSQPTIQVPVQLAVTDNGQLPSGFPVVWFEAEKSLTLGNSTRHRTAQSWPLEKQSPKLICHITSPTLVQAENRPPSGPVVETTSLQLHGVFRGQVLSGQLPVRLYLTPDVVKSKYGPSDEADIAIRADSALHQKYGDGNGAVAIVLDCTGSMGPAEGEPFTSRTKYAEANRALGQVLSRLPFGTTLSVWVFGQADGLAKTVAAPEQTIRRVIDPVCWDPSNAAQLSDLLRTIEYPALEPWNESPIVRAILAAKQDLQNRAGFKTIVVLTDGIDNRVAKDPVLNPHGKQVSTLLREAFQGSGIELNIVGFRMAADEEAKSWKQFQAVKSLSPPGAFCTVTEIESLTDALDIALRQRMRYWIQDGAHQAVNSAWSRGFEVSRTGTNDQWLPGGLPAGNYWITLNTATPLQQAIALNRGDRLLMKLVETPRGVALSRVVFGKEDVSWKPSAENGEWRATLLRNQLDYPAGQRILLGLERDVDSGESAISLVRPDDAWIEMTSQNVNGHNQLMRWHRSWDYPLAAWNLVLPRVQIGDAKADTTTSLRMWWSSGQLIAPDVALRRFSDFQQISDLSGREITIGRQTIFVESVTIENHPVQVGPERRDVRTCLTVRLRYPPEQTLWARPKGTPIAGSEHRFYQDIGQYIGLFWPVTKDSVNRSLVGLDLTSAETFRRSAAQFGNTIEFKQLSAPDPNDLGPQSITLHH